MDDYVVLQYRKLLYGCYKLRRLFHFETKEAAELFIERRGDEPYYKYVLAKNTL